MNLHIAFLTHSKLDADSSWESADSVSSSFTKIYNLHDFDEILIFDELDLDKLILFFRYLIFKELQAWFWDNLLRN